MTRPLVATVVRRGGVAFGTAQTLDRIPLPPRAVLATLGAIQAAQWVAVAALALDASSDDAGPALAALNVGLLLPVALAAAYAAGAALGGARIGVLAAAAWAAFPFAAMPFVDPRYAERWNDGLAPRAVGLTDAPEFPAAVALLVAAALATPVLTGRVQGQTLDTARAAAAGLAAGAACAVDGSALLFLPAGAAAFAVARRPRELAAFAAGALPGMAAVALLGWWPDLGGAGTWGFLHRHELLVREYFWSVRLPEWLLVAGLAGALRRSPPAATLLGGWAAAFLLARGTDRALTVENGRLFAELLPALPAYVVLAAAIPLLAPPVGWRSLAARATQRARSASRARS